jgi:hypothetical protein
MPETQNVVYDPVNRKLSTVVKYFADANQEGRSVDQIEWENGVKEGSEIKSGCTLAQIHWNKGPDTPIVAPDSCEGIIKCINGKIEYEWLHEKVQVLLCLKQQKDTGVAPSIQQAAKPAQPRSTKMGKAK